MSNNSWKNETIDNNGNTTQPSLIINKTNTYFVSYYEITNMDLKLAYKNQTSSWNISTIDVGDDQPTFHSLSIDDTDTIYICYYDLNEEDLKLISKHDNLWKNETVDSFGDVGSRCQMVVDKQGGIHIAYLNMTTYPDYTLKYAYKKFNSKWNIITLDYVGSHWYSLSITLDKLDAVHICYRLGYELKYAYSNNDGNWKIETIDNSSGDTGFGSSICVDSNLGVHVSYYDVSNCVPKYAYKAYNGIWNIELIDGTLSDMLTETSIITDDMNIPHVVYSSSSYFYLKYATKIPTTIELKTILLQAPLMMATFFILRYKHKRNNLD